MNHIVVGQSRRYILNLSVLLACISGCNWFTPLAFILPEPKRTVAPEFAHLDGPVTVLSWVTPELLYDYPHLRYEIAEHTVNQLRANVEGVVCTDPTIVEDYVHANPRNRSPEAVGRHFETKYVMYIEVLDFQLRDPNTPDILQGQLWASIVMNELKDDGLPPERFELDPVRLAIPENGPTRYSPTLLRKIRKELYVEFGGAVAKKFYEHKEIVK